MSSFKTRCTRRFADRSRWRRRFWSRCGRAGVWLARRFDGPDDRPGRMCRPFWNRLKRLAKIATVVEGIQRADVAPLRYDTRHALAKEDSEPSPPRLRSTRASHPEASDYRTWERRRRSRSLDNCPDQPSSHSDYAVPDRMIFRVADRAALRPCVELSFPATAGLRTGGSSNGRSRASGSVLSCTKAAVLARRKSYAYGPRPDYRPGPLARLDRGDTNLATQRTHCRQASVRAPAPSRARHRQKRWYTLDTRVSPCSILIRSVLLGLL